MVDIVAIGSLTTICSQYIWNNYGEVHQFVQTQFISELLTVMPMFCP